MTKKIKQDCEHEFIYRFKEYITATFIARKCKCGLQEETCVSPLKWKPIGSFDARMS